MRTLNQISMQTLNSMTHQEALAELKKARDLIIMLHKNLEQNIEIWNEMLKEQPDD